MTIVENLQALDEAAKAAKAELDLIEASATNLRSFVAAYGLFASILTAKTGKTVSPNFNAIKAALEGLPDPE